MDLNSSERPVRSVVHRESSVRACLFLADLPRVSPNHRPASPCRADRFYVETQAISGAAGTNRASVRSSAKLTLASLRLRATRAAVLLIPRSRNRR